VREGEIENGSDFLSHTSHGHLQKNPSDVVTEVCPLSFIHGHAVFHPSSS
jgi:hypothetical protein